MCSFFVIILSFARYKIQLLIIQFQFNLNTSYTLLYKTFFSLCNYFSRLAVYPKQMFLHSRQWYIFLHFSSAICLCRKILQREERIPNVLSIVCLALEMAVINELNTFSKNFNFWRYSLINQFLGGNISSLTN